jgi:Domain of unknown function (DUF4381)
MPTATTPNLADPAIGPDPLAGLRDWHLPDPVSWWPPAPGWWLVAGLALAAGALVLHWWLRRRRQGAPARAALAELERLGAGLVADRDGRQYAAAVSALLRRLALVRYPREQVAGLAGADWLAFLDRSGGGGRFVQGPGQVLSGVPYRAPGSGSDAGGQDPSDAVLDPAGLAGLAADWIRANRRPAP